MAVKDLVEGTTETEAPVAIWQDTETNEIVLQYGYVSVSLPAEDFQDLSEFIQKANEVLEQIE